MKKTYNIKRHISLLLVMLMILTSLAGCSKRNLGETTQSSESTTEAATEEITTTAAEIESKARTEVTYPITLTDQIGRTVILEKPAEEIVSTYYISTVSLIALGMKDKVVGLEMKADTRELYKLAAPEFLQLPAVGSGKGINIEEIANLKPDLVIIPKKLQDNVAVLEELNIPVLVVDPETMDNFSECIDLLGKATGSFIKAEQLVNYYEAKMEEVKVLTKDIENKPKVYLGSGSGYLSTCTSNMYQDDLISIAGGENVSAELTDGYWQEISAEQLLSWNPEFIFRVSYAEYALDDILNDSNLGEISAVKTNQVYTFPSNLEAWDYPTPSSVLGILWLTNVLHPDVYSQEDYINEAKEFYSTYFNIQVSNEDIGLK